MTKSANTTIESAPSRLPVALSAKLPNFKHYLAVLLATGLSAFIAHVGIVFCLGSEKQMVRSNAGAIVATVENPKIVGKRAVVQFPTKGMGKAHSAATDRKLPVATVKTSGPNPAGTEFRAMGLNRAILVHFRPEARFDGANWFAVVPANVAAKPLPFHKGWLDVKLVCASSSLATSDDSASFSHIHASDLARLDNPVYITGTMGRQGYFAQNGGL